MTRDIGKNILFRSAKEIALMSIMTALLLASQFVLAAIQGVEVVTVFLLSFCVAFGARRGMLVATAFSFMRCFIYGFFPNVVILYLVYYNFFALVFGLLGLAIAKLPVYAKIIILTVAATLLTACFTLLDDLITPWMLGYTEKSARVYFYASLPVLGIQCVCAAVTVALLWYPLSKVFSVVSFANHKSKKTQLVQDFSVISSDKGISEQNITVLQQERQLHSDKEQSIIDTKFVGGK